MPRPARVRTSTRPRSASTAERTASRPTPRPDTPLTCRAVVSPGSKIAVNASASVITRPALARTRSTSIPRPSSETAITTSPPICVAWSRTTASSGFPCAARSSGGSMPWSAALRTRATSGSRSRSRTCRSSSVSSPTSSQRTCLPDARAMSRTARRRGAAIVATETMRARSVRSCSSCEDAGELAVLVERGRVVARGARAAGARPAAAPPRTRPPAGRARRAGGRGRGRTPPPRCGRRARPGWTPARRRDGRAAPARAIRRWPRRRRPRRSTRVTVRGDPRASARRAGPAPARRPPAASPCPRPSSRRMPRRRDRRRAVPPAAAAGAPSAPGSPTSASSVRASTPPSTSGRAVRRPPRAASIAASAVAPTSPASAPTIARPTISRTASTVTSTPSTSAASGRRVPARSSSRICSSSCTHGGHVGEADHRRAALERVRVAEHLRDERRVLGAADSSSIAPSASVLSRVPASCSNSRRNSSS